MKIRFAILAGLICCAMAHAAAPSDAKTTLAIELMEATHYERTVHAMIDQVPAMMEQQLQPLATCDAAKPIVQKFSKDIADKLTATMLTDDYKVDAAAVYAEVFSEDELRQIIAFYHSPIGEKMLARMPDLLQKSMQIAQRRMSAVMPDIQKLGESYGRQIVTACKSSTSNSAISPKL